MGLRRTLLIGGAGFAAFIVASSLTAVINTVVSSLVPGASSDKPGLMKESLEEKAKRETAEQKSKDEAEKEKQQSVSQKTSEGSSAEVVDSSEVKPDPLPQAAPQPPRSPTPGPGNLGYQPPQYTPFNAGGPGNLN